MFGKSFNSKFKTIINNTLARIALLKKQHHCRSSQARSDVVQLLNLGHQESAILRVDHVIKEQNLLDALVIIEGYCCLLIERIALIRNTTICPEELKEAIASLIFAASRYGQLPELQKITRIFMKKYGKEFINYAIELRNSCGVNPKIAKRLPNRRTSLGTRLKVLKEIAAEHGITLQQEGKNPEATEEKTKARKTTTWEDQEPNTERESPEEKMKDEVPKASNRYINVKQAAQAACELAAEAAVAARAAVELSQTQSHDDDYDHQRRKVVNHNEDASFTEVKPRKVEEEEGLNKNDVFDANFRKFNIQMSNKSFRSRSKEAEPSNMKAQKKGISPMFTSESDTNTDTDTYMQMVIKIPEQDHKTRRMEIDPDGKRDVSKSRPSKHPWLEKHDWDTNKRFSSFMNEFLQVKYSEADKDENRDGSSDLRPTQDSSTEGSSRGRRPISFRTRRTTATPRRRRRPVPVRP